MTDNINAPAPIMVPESPAKDITESQIGPIVAAIGGVIMAFGALSPEKWTAVAGLLPYVIVAVWRAYRAYQKHAERVVMANAAPDAVAKVAK